LRKIKTLKKNYEFQRVLSKGKFFIGKQITVYTTKNNTDSNVIGIAISTKTCNAVKRNRIRRLIRENYILIKNDLKKGYNIVFLWNRKDLVENAKFDIIKKDMYELLKKAEILEWTNYL